MNKPTLSIVVAVMPVDGKYFIGENNRLPWGKVREDLARFKKITLGHHLIMGRKTFESIAEAIKRPLPERVSVILTHDKKYQLPDEWRASCKVAHSLEEAIELCRDEEEVFIVGGGEIYRQAIGICKRMYLTRIHAMPTLNLSDCNSGVYFPAFGKEWKIASKSEKKAVRAAAKSGEKSGNLYYQFFIYEKRGA